MAVISRSDGRELWNELFEVMKDRERCELHEVPVTGVPPEYEHMMSSMFIDDIKIRVCNQEPQIKVFFFSHQRRL